MTVIEADGDGRNGTILTVVGGKGKGACKISGRMHSDGAIVTSKQIVIVVSGLSDACHRNFAVVWKGMGLKFEKRNKTVNVSANNDLVVV